MLYHLLWPLHEQWGVFNVFRYITFRAAYAALTALIIGLLIGPWLIRRLRELKIGQSIREEGPKSHGVKAGTPTMGGVLIVIGIVTPTLLWADLTNKFIWLALAAMLAFASLGFIDDYAKLMRKRNLGLKARHQLMAQAAFSLVVGFILVEWAGRGEFQTTIGLPFFKDIRPDLGLLYVPFVMLVLVCTSNAVNLTDGLDGLAGGATMIAAGTYAILAYVAGHVLVADYLAVEPVRDAGELAVFLAATVGALLAFLWFNAPPAEVFMGDTGSLALGGAIGTVALAVKQELLLVIVGGIFVLEGLSVVVQVASFKLTGRRVLRMAPLHHHFEQLGWAESKIVVRFWIGCLIFALFGLSTLKLR